MATQTKKKSTASPKRPAKETNKKPPQNGGGENGQGGPAGDQVSQAKHGPINGFRLPPANSLADYLLSPGKTGTQHEYYKELLTGSEKIHEWLARTEIRSERDVIEIAQVAENWSMWNTGVIDPMIFENIRAIGMMSLHRQSREELVKIIIGEREYNRPRDTSGYVSALNEQYRNREREDKSPPAH